MKTIWMSAALMLLGAGCATSRNATPSTNQGVHQAQPASPPVPTPQPPPSSTTASSSQAVRTETPANRPPPPGHTAGGVAVATPPPGAHTTQGGVAVGRPTPPPGHVVPGAGNGPGMGMGPEMGAGMMGGGLCTRSMPGSSVRAEDTVTGAALLFTTNRPGEVATLRAKVRAMAARHKSMQGMRGRGMQGRGMAKGPMHGGMTMHTSRVVARDVPNGAMLEFQPMQAAQRSQIRTEVHQHATWLQSNDCGAAGPRRP
jgi:hypothetical protein